MTFARRISRRTVLRGLGTAMALPMLDAMVPLAQAAAKKQAPKRLAFLYVPNGVHMQDWTPTTEGVNYQMPWILEPLAPYQKELLVLTGLTQHHARVHRLHAVHAVIVLHRERGADGQRVRPLPGHRLQIRRQPGAAGRIDDPCAGPIEVGHRSTSQIFAET